MTKPVRVLAFFLDAYAEYGQWVGGMERRFLEISSRLTALGAEMFTLEYKPSLSEIWSSPKQYHSIGVQGRERYRKHTILETFRLILLSLGACIKFRCNVLYVCDRTLSGKLYIIPSYLTSLLCRKPLVIVFHHLRQQDYNEKNLITLSAYRQAKVIIAVSQATAKEIEKTFKVRRIIVTGNGVDLEKFQKLKNQQKIYDAIYFGRICKEKGIHTLLYAWKIVRQKMPSAKLFLMGGGEDKAECYYRELAKKLKLDRNVAFSGLISDQDALSMLNSSKIFVLPSTEEGFGLTVVEAMATGLPCILSDIPALRENFYSSAVFVKPQDAEELAQAILTLLSNPEKRKKLKEKGRRLVKQFSWDDVAKKELAVLSSLL